MARRLGGVAVVVVVGAAMHGGAPADAQLELPPLTLEPTDPATTTTTLLPNLLADENLIPAPQPTAPPSSLLPLPLPTAPPPRRTTTFKPTPVPPSTPVRAPKVAAKPKAPAARTTSASAAPVDESELGEGPGYGAELPFPGDNEATTLSAADTMELGIEDSTREQVGTMASVAAGLIAFVLLGIALWLRSEARRPAPLPPW